jgi:hypothetical protein
MEMNSILTNNSISYAQKQRLRKIRQEQFYLLKFTQTSQINEFKVSGSTSNVYTIKLKNDTNKFSCDCPDFGVHCKKAGMLCKHICFIVFRVGRIRDADILINLTMTPAHKEALFIRISDTWDKFVQSELVSKFNELEVEKQTKKDMYDACNARNLVDSDCPVCFRLLSGVDISKLASCPTCNNAVHKECAKRWFRISNNDKCIVCRSPDWSLFMNNFDANYLNLNSILPS